MREQARRLSRNLSLSHESVFHIDSHNAQVSLIILFYSQSTVPMCALNPTMDQISIKTPNTKCRLF